MNTLYEFRDKIKNAITGKQFAIILVISIILIVVAVYFYKDYFKQKIEGKYDPNSEFLEGPRPDDVPTATLYFFYTNWCPHCKTARPIWNNFKKQIGTTTVKNKNIDFVEIDCDKDAKTAEKFKVEGYPTIILTYDNKVIEYDAKTSLDTLHQFLDSSL